MKSQWRNEPLGEVCRAAGGGTPSRREPRFWGGRIPWASVKDFKESNRVISDTEEHITEIGLTSSATRLIPAGTPLVCTRMAVGRSAVPICDVAINQDVKALFTMGRITSEYLQRLLEFHEVDLGRNAVGSTVKGISTAELLSFRVSFPEQELEQARIAEILDTVEAAIRATEAVITKLQRIKAGLLHDLLTRGLDDHGHLRDADHHPEEFQDSPLGCIPKDWDILPIAQCFDMQLGKMMSKDAKKGRRPLPYLGNRSVQWERADLSKLEFMDFSETEEAKFSLEIGDVLVCEGGEVGRTAIWRGELDQCCFQKAIHRLRPKTEDASPDFLLMFMRRAVDIGWLQNYTSQTSIPHLTQEKLAIVPFLRPKPDEQRAVVKAFRVWGERISAQEKELSKLQSLKRGLAHDLLTGRVRVKPKSR
jgi:type I restriction enzyme S subunit